MACASGLIILWRDSRAGVGAGAAASDRAQAVHVDAIGTVGTDWIERTRRGHLWLWLTLHLGVATVGGARVDENAAMCICATSFLQPPSPHPHPHTKTHSPHCGNIIACIQTEAHHHPRTRAHPSSATGIHYSRTSSSSQLSHSLYFTHSHARTRHAHTRLLTSTYALASGVRERRIHARKCGDIRMHDRTHARTRACTQISTHAYIHTLGTRARARARPHTHTHTHTHTHWCTARTPLLRSTLAHSGLRAQVVWLCQSRMVVFKVDVGPGCDFSGLLDGFQRDVRFATSVGHVGLRWVSFSVAERPTPLPNSPPHSRCDSPRGGSCPGAARRRRRARASAPGRHPPPEKWNGNITLSPPPRLYLRPHFAGHRVTGNPLFPSPRRRETSTEALASRCPLHPGARSGACLAWSRRRGPRALDFGLGLTEVWASV